MTLDFLGLEKNYSAEEKLLVESVRGFVNSQVMPHISKWFENGHFERELALKLGSLGILGAQLDGPEFLNLKARGYGLVLKELERGDSGLRSFASVQGGLVMYPIHAFGSQEQKEKYLPLLRSGELIGCFGLTEPDFGSNPAGMRTKAEKKGANWILNGSKTWITNSPIAGVAVVWARTSEGIQGFLVDSSTTGFEAPEIKHKLSLRASCTGSLFFKDCVIPDSQRLPKGQGLKAALMCLNQARFGITWGALGAAEDCLQEALSYTNQRILFDKPLSSFQLVQQKLAQMSTQITLGQLLAERLANLKDSGELEPHQISMGKQNNVKIALEIARTTRDILGANGVSLEYRCMRHACNLESVFTYEGTNDVHLLIIGQKLTGQSAFV